MNMLYAGRLHGKARAKVASSAPATSAVTCPAWLQGICDWVHNPTIPCDQQWVRSCPGAPGLAEGGVDLISPVGTPVYALATGPLIGYGWDTAGGGSGWVLSQRINVPGYGTQDIYYQHMNYSLKYATAPLGTIIPAGTQIGSVGAWHGEVEVGFNPTWGGPWGDPSKRPGPWVSDPRPMILALMGGGGVGVPATGGTTTATTGLGNILGLPQAFLDWLTNPLRFVKLFTGIIALLLALYLAISEPASDMAKKFFTTSMKVASA